jgi:hypothetical protein
MEPRQNWRISPSYPQLEVHFGPGLKLGLFFLSSRRDNNPDLTIEDHSVSEPAQLVYREL